MNSNKTMLISLDKKSDTLTNFAHKDESYTSFKNNVLSGAQKVSVSDVSNNESVENKFLYFASDIIKEIDTLQNSYDIGSVDTLRMKLIELITTYAETLSNSNIENSQIIIARYILCTVSDELISSTYWGKDNNWSNNSLLVYFYNETYGGEKFFQILDQLFRSSAKYIHLLELMYVCLSLGFEGRYRIHHRGKMEIDTIRENLYRQIKMIQGHSSKSFFVPHKVSNTQNKLIYKTPYQTLIVGISVMLFLVYGILTFSLKEKEDVFQNFIQTKYTKYTKYTNTLNKDMTFVKKSKDSNE
ncbi:MAG: type IVB secretion system protein IcmH/DotU [Candidatus Delongbacteria bacterium]|nr:type IVB secretion system protein IcmH/DotU [Candidatus Delongbacteria bacterium]